MKAMISGLAILLLALLAPASALAATPAPAASDGASATACSGGAWPWSVQGSPSFHAGSAAGDYLWHDRNGWHLRVTHPHAYRAVFTGTIRANEKLTVTAYRLESEDTFKLSADGTTLTYRFVDHGGLDGVDFTTACATRLGFSGRMSGALLPARRVWLGHAGRHPLQNPFVLLRRA